MKILKYNATRQDDQPKPVRLRKPRVRAPVTKQPPSVTEDATNKVEEDNSNRVFNSHINTTSTLEQEANRRRLAALTEESQSKIAIMSTDVADGSVGNQRSKDSGRGLFPIEEKDCTLSAANYPAVLDGDALGFTIGRNAGAGVGSQTPSRNAGLGTA